MYFKSLFLFGFISLWVYSPLQSQDIGYIHQDSILQVLPNYNVALENLIQEEEAYNNEIKQNTETFSNKLQQLLNRYSATEGESLAQIKQRMQPADTLSLNVIITEGNMIDNKKKTYNSLIQARYNQDIKPLLDNLNNVISNYAKKQKLSAVYILDNMAVQLAYIDEKNIITGAIIELITNTK